jgi:hypothetical protein
MLKIYGKKKGNNCWLLTINGKETAPFDKESDVDDIIAMEDELNNRSKNVVSDSVVDHSANIYPTSDSLLEHINRYR